MPQFVQSQERVASGGTSCFSGDMFGESCDAFGHSYKRHVIHVLALVKSSVEQVDGG